MSDFGDASYARAAAYEGADRKQIMEMLHRENRWSFAPLHNTLNSSQYRRNTIITGAVQYNPFVYLPYRSKLTHLPVKGCFFEVSILFCSFIWMFVWIACTPWSVFKYKKEYWIMIVIQKWVKKVLKVLWYTNIALTAFPTPIIFAWLYFTEMFSWMFKNQTERDITCNFILLCDPHHPTCGRYEPHPKPYIALKIHL